MHWLDRYIRDGNSRNGHYLAVGEANYSGPAWCAMTPTQRAALAVAVAILELAGMRPEVSRMYGARKAAAILLEVEITEKELEEQTNAKKNK